MLKEMQLLRYIITHTYKYYAQILRSAHQLKKMTD